jgi:hypothetical protein
MRTPSERRLLLDATQLAVFVGMLLDLGLPWWTRTEFHETYATFTGWHSLSVSPNFGWLVIIAAVPTALAWWLRRRWLSIVAAVVAVMLLVLGAASQAHLDGDGQGFAYAGFWIGWLLIAISAALRVADIVVARQVDEVRLSGTASS